MLEIFLRKNTSQVVHTLSQLKMSLSLILKPKSSYSTIIDTKNLAECWPFELVHVFVTHGIYILEHMQDFFYWSIFKNKRVSDFDYVQS